mgnify:CR=1 FL=1
MTAIPIRRSKFTSGTMTDGRLLLIRDNGTTARCGVVIIRDATLTDNGDGTWDVVSA